MHRSCHVSLAVVFVGDGLEPHIFPEEIALSLAATMGQAITVQTGEMDRGLETADFPGLACRIAGLVGDSTDTKTSPAILQHLRHKRQTVHGTVLIQRCQDLFLTANFNQIASAIAR